MVVPTMLARIVEVLAERDATIPSLRHLSYGGGKMPHPVIDEALYLLPHTNFVNAYGLTETSSTICLLGPEDHREAHRNDDPAVRQRLSSVGRPLPSIEVSIRDEQGNEVEPYETGEIWVRGEQVSGEYLGRGSQLNADGWFCTKDGGWMDEGGFLYISGRVDDIIIRGGENISPGEIEDVLMEHPAVADACAIGVPDAHWGERVVAAIVLHEGSDITQDQLQEFVKTYLRSSRTPEHIEFRPELPYNETGKLLRRVVRDDLSYLGDGSTL
jgi:acyl-CoA synthetase (AMP-forming)/AMP-acid ligase II